MTNMRAKMRVSNIVKHEGGNETLHFSAVAKSDGYPQDGSDEDNSYARWSPSGELRLEVANPALWGKFALDERFYLDFTKAD